MDQWQIVIAVVVGILIIFPLLMSRVLRTVESGTIRIVSLMGATRVYRGPGKSFELPLLTTGTTIPSKAINIDLDISDQTADLDSAGMPRPIKVRVLASAIVSVGDSNETIRTAANRFFAKPDNEQTSTLTDLLTSTGRRAINLLHHDELFNAKANSSTQSSAEALAKLSAASLASVEEDDRLAIIIKSACSRELQDLGLVFNSLNIKSVQSEVAEARRRQSAVEAKANADIVQADQERRAREAQLTAETAVNDKTRELDQRKAENAAIIATAEAKKQQALEALREAELRATQIAQATADAAKVKIQAEAAADAEAVRLRKTAAAQADAIRDVTQAMKEGGSAYITLRQLELLPQIAPSIANALAQAKLINISSDPNKGAAGGAVDQISQVIQTVIAAQLVNGQLGSTFVPATGSGQPDPTPTRPDGKGQAPNPRPAPSQMASDRRPAPTVADGITIPPLMNPQSGSQP